MAALGGFGEWVSHNPKAGPGESPGVGQGVEWGSPILSNWSRLLLTPPSIA